MNNDNIIIKFNNINHNKNDYKLFSIFSTFFEKKKSNKKVTFTANNSIYLIDNEKHKELFYNVTDYNNFRMCAHNDISYVMAIKYVNYAEAKKILFQPK